MDTRFTKEELLALRAPFALDKHTVREGLHNKADTKVRWFAYIERQAVQDRLDQIFPGEWETTEPHPYMLGQTVSATVGISIREIIRWDGGDDDTGEGIKGAITNGFRRVAAYGWGIARYLYDMDIAIWTDGYTKGDWNAQKQRHAEAWGQFERWYEKQFPSVKLSKTIDIPPAEAKQLLTKQGESVLGRDNGAASAVWTNGENVYFWQEVYKLYDNSQHAQNSVAKMRESGELPLNASPDKALEIVRKHVANK